MIGEQGYAGAVVAPGRQRPDRGSGLGSSSRRVAGGTRVTGGTAPVASGAWHPGRPPHPAHAAEAYKAPGRSLAVQPLNENALGQSHVGAEHSQGRGRRREQLQQVRKEGRGKRGAKRGENDVKFSQKLGLSLSQQTQIKSIRQRAQTDIQAVRSNTTLSKNDKRTQLNTIHDNVQNAISAVLTPAQRDQREAMKAERKANRGERKANRRERKENRQGRKANRNNGLNS